MTASGPTQDFRGQVALVTGAGSGIGRATAVLLAQRGASVTLVGRRADKLDEVAAEISDSGGRALPLPGDVSQPADIEYAVNRTVERFGALHLAVNNAGVSGVFTPLHEEAVDDWRRVIGINLDSVFYGLKYQIPAMLTAGGGAVVNVSSVFADRGGQPRDYATAKHGLRGLTRSAAIEYADKNIRVNELAPGVIDTELTSGNPEQTQAVTETGIPMRRVGAATEIATAIAFLLSDEASYITGAHLAVDGGFLA